MSNIVLLVTLLKHANNGTGSRIIFNSQFVYYMRARVTNNGNEPKKRIGSLVYPGTYILDVTMGCEGTERFGFGLSVLICFNEGFLDAIGSQFLIRD